MKKIITLLIKSKQEYSLEESDLIEYSTKGILYKKREKYYLIYENKELAESKTRVKIDPIKKKILINRDKPYLEQEFMEKNRFSSQYRASYGNFDMEIYTKLLNIQIGDNKGKIKIDYKLYLNKKYISNNFLDISWQVKKEEDKIEKDK